MCGREGPKSEAWKAHMREIMKVKSLGNTYRRGKTLTDAQKLTISETTKLAMSKLPAASKKRLIEGGRSGGLALKGKPKSASHRQNIGLAQLGKKHGPASEHRKQAISAAHKGMRKPWMKIPRSKETKAKMSASRQKHLNTHAGDCRCRGRTWITGPSSLAWDMIDFFTTSGFEILIPEQSFGRYTVDVYLPDYHLALEADGEYWHRETKEYDEQRDAYLMEKFSLPVVRFTQYEIEKFRKGGLE